MRLRKRVQPKHTTFFVVGSSFRGEDYVMREGDRLAHVGVLFSYVDLREYGLTWKRLKALKE